MGIRFYQQSGQKKVARRRIETIYTSETAECGLACLTMMLNYYGQKLVLSDVRRFAPASRRGLTLRTLVDIAGRLGGTAKVYKCGIDGLRKLGRPIMLHWNLDHIVVLEKVVRGRYHIHDPSRGKAILSEQELSNHFTGIILDFHMEPNSRAKLETGDTISIRGVLNNINGFWSGLLKVSWLSLLVEACNMGVPLLLKAALDPGRYEFRYDAISLVLMLILIAYLFGSLNSYIRDFTSLNIGLSLNKQFSELLFDKLLRLPVSFFEKRNAGTLQDRYRSFRELSNVLAQRAPNLIMDGFFSLVSLAILTYIYPLIGIVSFLLVAVLGYAKLRFFELSRYRLRIALDAHSEEFSTVIETLKAITTIKSNGGEFSRMQRWSTLHSRYLNAEHTSKKLTISENALVMLLRGLDTGIAAFILGVAISNGELTVGTAFAAIYYKSHFFERINLSLTNLLNIRLMFVHVQRLEDIIVSDAEMASLVSTSSCPAPAACANSSSASVSNEVLKIRDLSFRYSDSDPLIINGAAVSVAENEFLAIIGSSGAGKSTLIKLLLGLYPVSDSKIILRDRCINELPAGQLRSQYSVVMQRDHLLSGTIEQNISFFDPMVDSEKLYECARLACIHDDIEKMPMGYLTRIGDNGSGFSGGQEQRLMIARALYRDPKILILDEGTANLDPETENTILENLKKLKITKIVISHGENVLSHADRVVRLKDGRITEFCQKA